MSAFRMPVGWLFLLVSRSLRAFLFYVRVRHPDAESPPWRVQAIPA